MGLTFLVPLAFAITVPARAVTSRLGASSLLAAAIFTVVILALARWLWTVGLHRYSGASA